MHENWRNCLLRNLTKIHLEIETTWRIIWVCSTAVYMYIYVAVNTGAMRFSHHHHHPQSCYVCPMGVIGHPLLSWAAHVALHHSMFVSIKSFWILVHLNHNFRSAMFLFALRFPIHYEVQRSSHNTLTSTYNMTNPFPDLPLLLFFFFFSFLIIFYLFKYRKKKHTK